MTHFPLQFARLGLTLILVGCAVPETAGQETAHFATGIKIGEVTDSSAIVWTRLTAHPERVPATAPMFRVIQSGSMEKKGSSKKTGDHVSVEFPDGTSIDSVRFAVPGAPGDIQIRFRREGQPSWTERPFESVNVDRDFTWQKKISGLQPASRYEVQLIARPMSSAKSTDTINGRFRTAPSPSQIAEVKFAVSTGQAFVDRDGDHGFDLYRAIQQIDPDFFVHTGDIVYYDQLAKNAALARYHWQRTYSLPTNVDFHRQVASYFIKDDHDTLANDCWPTQRGTKMGEMTFAKGLAIFREQVPMGKSTYRTYRWGRDLQVWLVEGRDFRSPNNAPDGPDKSIWGRPQKDWFKSTVSQSDATFKVLISPTPLVGPDRPNKADNHANLAFAHEGNELRQFISQHSNMFVICGDRHWQYHSIDPQTGVREYSCGPASEKHAGGWRKDDFRKDYHRFLRVGGGFLAVSVSRRDARPMISFRFCDTTGDEKFEDSHLSPSGD